ncbi:magnesium transporter [Pseudahrensia aquimaris]|uniref:Magnesium transporter MgtE n=1 Tax=Pseudahrensia aquimaris TaxID=744461 RepID=A0ABW3FLD1_9HYPH
MSQEADEIDVEGEGVSAIYTVDGAVREDVLANIHAAIEAGDAEPIIELTRDLHESETADLLEALRDDERQAFVRLSGADFDFTVLTEVDEAIRVDIVDGMEAEQVAEGVRDLDSDDAVFILEDLGNEAREEILAQIPFQERIRLRRSLDYPEETAGRRMQTEFIAVPPFWTVGQAIDYIRETDDLPDRFSEIFTIEPTFKLAGMLPLDKLIKAKRDIRVEDIHDTNAHPIPALMDQEEAAQIFEQYDLLSAPVLDENDRLVGVLTIDDVVDVIQAEADEDIRLLAGVGDEELSDSVRDIARSRVGWLLVNLATAIFASLIIGLFDATIEQMVALAVLMPIVASMGGNAGTQTMTVAVRALATKDLDINNARRIIRKEMLVGLFNGLVFAVIIGLVAAVWFGLPSLGLVIGIAMIINMLFAAGAGILIPMALDKWGADPAIASGVFVTTVTDVIGFFAFLGLAAWWYGI